MPNVHLSSFSSGGCCPTLPTSTTLSSGISMNGEPAVPEVSCRQKARCKEDAAHGTESPGP
jgi:hypothetical protein